MADAPFAEVIWIGDETWVKAGDQWIQQEADEAKQSFDDFLDAFKTDDEMTLVGTETISGIRADRYLHDYTSPDGNLKMHREIWIANQDGLPKVGLKAYFRMESKQDQGSLVNETEATVTEINEPLEIKRPE